MSRRRHEQGSAAGREVTALPVRCDEPRLLRLLQLYIHEWSGRIHIQIGADGLYPYPDLASFTGDNHDCVLFMRGGLPIGFALAAHDLAGVWHVEELFIVSGQRRLGAGETAARALFARHPGPWSLTTRPENPGGFAFWRRIIGPPPTPELGEDGITRQRFSFTA